MPTDYEDLKRRLATARESLDTELKRWIDPDSDHGICVIAKACLALRNYDGGSLIIGVCDDGTPDTENVPDDIRATFSPGKIQKIVTKYAAETGLRASELASLTSDSFNFDDSPPTVTILPEHEKAGRGDTLPIPEDLVAILRPWLAGIARNERVWPGEWAERRKGSIFIQADLASARRAWIE